MSVLSRFLATTTVAVAIAGCAEHPVAPESPAIAMKRAATAAEVPITCEVTWMSPVNGSWADASKWSTGTVPTAADNVCISVDGTYAVRLQSSATVSSIMVGQPGNTGVQTLVVEAFNATTTLTATGDVINHGDIALAWNRGTNGQAAILASTGGTVFNHGLLRTVPDAIGAPRVLAANLLNTGTVTLAFPLTLNKANAIYENRGTFNNTAGLTLAPNIGQVFRQADGVLNTTGAVNVNQSRFEFDGGEIAGTANRIVVTDGVLAIGEGSEGAGTFTLHGASTLEGDIAAEQHVTVEAFNANASLTSATAFTNAGHINLQWNRGTNGHAAILAVTEGVLTNTGVIQAFTDAIAAPRVIAASITNAAGGSVIIGTPTTFNKAGAVFENHGDFVANRAATFTNGAGQVFRQVEGTLSLNGSGSVTLVGQTLEITGGTIVGMPTIPDGLLRFTEGATGSGLIGPRGSGARLEGDIPAGYTVRLLASSATSAVLTAAHGFTNRGTIELTAIGGTTNGAQSHLVVTEGVLTNEGVIATVTDAFGGTGRVIRADLVNRGTLDIRTPSSFAKQGATIVNENKILLNNRSLTINGLGQTFITRGHIGETGSLNLTGITFRASGTIAANVNLTNVVAHVGDGIDGLQVTGIYRMITGGTLNVDLSGDPLGNDKITVSGTATLLGTLNAAAFAGSCIDPGLSFEIMRYGSRAGDFTTKNLTLGGGRAVVAVPAATTYTLNSTGADCAPADVTAPVIAPSVSGTLGLNGWYVSDVQVSWSVADEESPVMSTVGCSPSSVTHDTAEQVFTCTATSAGGTATQSVTIKRDATAPMVVVTRSPLPDASGWNNSPVTATWTATDALSGVEAPASATHVFDTDGANQTATRSFTDRAGNGGSATISGVNIDTRPRVLVPSCSATPDEIWPPNNKMVPVLVRVVGDGITGITLRSVTNNETGTADISGWQLGAADFEGTVRATRNGSGTGRTYTLVYDVTGAGNAAGSCSVTVKVAHDQGRGK